MDEALPIGIACTLQAGQKKTKRNLAESLEVTAGQRRSGTAAIAALGIAGIAVAVGITVCLGGIKDERAVVTVVAEPVAVAVYL